MVVTVSKSLINFNPSALDAVAGLGVDGNLVWSPNWNMATLLK